MSCCLLSGDGGRLSDVNKEAQLLDLHSRTHNRDNLQLFSQECGQTFDWFVQKRKRVDVEGRV